ncbi:MAG TPA: ribonuclease T [Alphaproteobacteria bacterium]|nr:ribonuclease T [Alphaproteobacteria bacterium]HAJ48543.1 ribonuclease T [Alphaproteobacteria bacterium]
MAGGVAQLFGDRSSPSPALAAEPARAAASAAKPASVGSFDYYVVALSWSPTYCLEEADPRRDRRQCQSTRPFAFVLHGLWPQYERGYPKDCQTDEPRVPDHIIEGVLDIMPSRGLAGHQWRKHGACTGLSHQAYFDAARAAYRKVQIPSAYTQVSNYVTTSPVQVERAFLAANPGLSATGVQVTCTRKHLREVRVCMTKDFKFRSCGADVQKDCTLPSVVMPPAR